MRPRRTRLTASRQFIGNALGLTCASHYAGAVCGFHLGDEAVVDRLERLADSLKPRESTRAAIPVHARKEIHHDQSQAKEARLQP